MGEKRKGAPQEVRELRLLRTLPDGEDGMSRGIPLLPSPLVSWSAFPPGPISSPGRGGGEPDWCDRRPRQSGARAPPSRARPSRAPRPSRDALPGMPGRGCQGRGAAGQAEGAGRSRAEASRAGSPDLQAGTPDAASPTPLPPSHPQLPRRQPRRKPGHLPHPLRAERQLGMRDSQPWRFASENDFDNPLLPPTHP
ncbi:translation initiation factor IF-2-like isoform X2 [Tachyglossus aculeatus]|uniref:translation initiation factor IF-2-like isoform X2 n=1 Tax=Tachyglossus aculeatus TaxID=9261 RepID=UPI0018F6A9DF|nr:translation initiation factor IF-2-like isoform X2 [Tachyglossus aculeatus]